MKSGYSIGFCRSLVIPLDSAGVWLFRWIPPEFGYSSGFRRSPVDLLSRKSPDGFHGLRWNMLVSSGLCRTPPGINMPIWPLSHQDIPGFESSGFQWNLLDSGSFRQRRWGSVQSSPVRHVGCNQKSIFWCIRSL